MLIIMYGYSYKLQTHPNMYVRRYVCTYISSSYIVRTYIVVNSKHHQHFNLKFKYAKTRTI